MKISTKGRYALRLMLDLAVHDTGTAIPLKEVASRQGISVKYLEQIVTQLSRGGLVRSVRGAVGGYFLIRKPEEYTVGEILRQLEGSLAPVQCADPDFPCDRADQCVTLEVWQKIEQAVSNVVDNITLGDLVRRYEEKTGLTVPVPPDQP
jgi:Rrf2 family protein